VAQQFQRSRAVLRLVPLMACGKGGASAARCGTFRRRMVLSAPFSSMSNDGSAKMILEPAEAFDKLDQVGIKRADRPSSTILLSSVLGGAYLSFGGCLYMLVAGGSGALQETLPGLFSLATALVFPTGLSLIVLTGVDLLTSNMLYGVAPFTADPEKSKSRAVADYAKLTGLSFAGNFAASVTFAAAASFCLFPPGSGPAVFASALAAKKCALPAGQMFVKAMGANWLVNLAVFQAATATSTASKILAVWMPVTAFVALGLEHSVANMFTIPLGMLSGGAEIGAADAARNLMIVTAGNAIGAGLFVGLAQGHCSKASSR